ncbi:MAG: RnfABCDGE type electron transport complex subunit D [Lachnospiraceae bacterium]|nr:RnfABCDGE type electron transport complex subunit D [Lachnospiraceae bacterium]
MGRSRGINIYEKAWEQLTREKSFEGYVPEKVCISLGQEKGVQCHLTVVQGESVCRGQVIGETEPGQGCCVHASIDGYIEKISNYQRAPGIQEPCVLIRRDSKKAKEWHPFAMDFGKKAVHQALHRIGLPAQMLQKREILVVNGFANEPYITSGYRLMMESPGKIIIGAILGAMAAEAESIYICINDDAFDAVARMKHCVKKYGQNMGNQRPIWVVPVKHRYPKGNEKILLGEVLGRRHLSAALVTLAEMSALYDGIYDGEPWTRVGITVSGEVATPKNLWVPIGTNVQDVIDYCGGKTGEGIIIHGGPLSGKSIDGPNTWVTKETCGIIVLKPPKVLNGPCIHCGQCREVCPQGLMPDQIEAIYLSGREIPDSYRAADCIKCGLCSYVCPSERRLTEYMGQVKKGRKRGTTEKNGKKEDYIELKAEALDRQSIQPLEEKSQSAPHIHRRGTIHDMMKQSIFALIPLLIGIFYINPGDRLHLVAMLITGVLSAVLSEYFWQMLRNEYLSIHDYSACFTGLLLPLLFPLDTPLWKISLGAVAAILIGKQIFGGIGHSPIHPVIVGKILLSPYGIPMIEDFWILAVFSVVWMIVKRMNPAEYSLIFLLLLWAGRPSNIFSASVCLAAAYFIQSYETMPPSRTGRWIFTLSAAGLTLLFQEFGLGIGSLFFSIACLDLTVPLLAFPSVKRI